MNKKLGWGGREEWEVQIDPPTPPEKNTLKKPSLIMVKGSKY